VDISTLFILIAVVLFGIEAVLRRSLVAAGLCLFALSFIVKTLL